MDHDAGYIYALPQGLSDVGFLQTSIYTVTRYFERRSSYTKDGVTIWAGECRVRPWEILLRRAEK
jgi:hypothetical protein